MPETPTLGRYAEIPYEQMTPEQQEGYRSLLETRGRLPGPNKIYVHNPKLVKVMGPLGAYFRTGYSLSEREREIAVIIVNSKWHSAYPTNAHERAVFRLIGRETAKNPEAVRVFGGSLLRDLARVGVPPRRVQQAGVDPGRVHVADAFFRGIGINLAMRRVGRRTGRPDVDLCIDDQHWLCPLFRVKRLSVVATDYGRGVSSAAGLRPRRGRRKKRGSSKRWCKSP